MKRHILLVTCLILAIACKEETDPFLITEHSIGLLTDSTQVKELKAIFSNDSISKYIGGDEFTGNINDINVYEGGGNHLLALTPFESLDSISTIKSIKIVDSRYKTTKGITKLSTFGDIQNKYKISRIQNTLSNIVVSVDAINAYFTIDKQELPAELRYDMDLKIEALQIPEKAKIKSFYIHWF